MLKKFVFVVVIFLISMFSVQMMAYAQNEHSSQSSKNASKSKISPVTLGVYGFFDGMVANSLNTSYYYDRYGRHYYYDYDTIAGVGGGGAVNLKINFRRWIALALDFSYTAINVTSGDYGYRNYRSGGSFSFSPMVIFQRETPRGQAGWVPYAGLGLSIFYNTLNWYEEYYNYYYGYYDKEFKDEQVGVSVTVTAGARYNFKNNTYLGFRFDYAPTYFEDFFVNNFRLGLEAGYRF